MRAAPAAFAQPHRAGNRRRHQPLVCHRRQIHEDGAIREAVHERGRGGHRQARFPHAAGAQKREQSHRRSVRVQQHLQRLDLDFAADK